MNTPRQIQPAELPALVERMVAAGAAIYDPRNGGSAVLAAAAIKGNTLWWFEAFGENQSAEHWLQFSQAEFDGYNLTFTGSPNFTLTPVEPPDETETWNAWQMRCAEDPAIPESINHLRDLFFADNRPA